MQIQKKTNIQTKHTQNKLTGAAHIMVIRRSAAMRIVYANCPFFSLNKYDCTALPKLHCLSRRCLAVQLLLCNVM